jgi:glutathione S-transferase
MANLTLVIGNKNYSSWSLRPWLALRVAGIPFEEVRIPLYLDGSRERILAYSPAGKVPVLVTPEGPVWESLAICEWAAEQFPDRGLWPRAAAARAHARAAGAEMHAGFSHLRRELPMNLRGHYPGQGMTLEVARDVARIEALWSEARSRFGAGGPFLYGAFSIADAFYAPVATRFLTYGVALGAEAQRYVAALRALPALAEWYRDAERETEVIPHCEPYQARSQPAGSQAAGAQVAR